MKQLKQLESSEFLDTDAAEQFCSLARATLLTMRKRDRHRIRYGLPLTGPKWIEWSERRIRYARVELIRWMNSKTVTA
jgi:hypothetical protein